MRGRGSGVGGRGPGSRGRSEGTLAPTHSLAREWEQTVGDQPVAPTQRSAFNVQPSTDSAFNHQPSVTRPIVRFRNGTPTSAKDVLAVEEPLEIRLLWEDGDRLTRRSITITMRTPGHDFELAAGFLVGESVVASRDDILDISYCQDRHEPNAGNIVSVTLCTGRRFDEARLERHFTTTSSCGVCGKASLNAISLAGCCRITDGFTVAGEVISRLPETLRAAQSVFDQTGGLHAAGLADATGRLISVREDVGRHNALDKLIGEQLLADRLPLADRILILSGRASFELLQKALVAGIPVVAAVGAPSSLAVDLANAYNITLAGFVRPTGFNVYSGTQRVTAESEPRQ